MGGLLDKNEQVFHFNWNLICVQVVKDGFCRFSFMLYNNMLYN